MSFQLKAITGSISSFSTSAVSLAADATDTDYISSSNVASFNTYVTALRSTVVSLSSVTSPTCS